MKLQNGYKVIYEVAAGGERTFYASKSNIYPNETDTIIASFKDEDFRGKVIYEYDGKFFVSKGHIPVYGENGEPVDSIIEGFDEVIIDGTIEDDFMAGSMATPQNPHTESISTNGDSHGTLVIEENVVTLKVTGKVDWKKSSWGTYGNWVGFRINVPEEIDATTAIYVRPNGKSSPLSDVLDAGKNYASVYSDMSKYGATAIYYLDWNGDGITDLTVIIDASEATLVAANTEVSS